MEMTELQDLESTYCDMHKDAYGVKARWYRAASVEQALYDINDLQQVIEEQIVQERRNNVDAAVRFEQRLKDLIEMGAKTRETALRWIHQAEGTDGDAEFLCHACGLKYGYFKTTHAHLM